MVIEDNIKIRDEARVAFQLIEEMAATLCEESRHRFWEILHYYVADVAGLVAAEDPKKDVRVMTEQEAKGFEVVEMPWGKYSGVRVADVGLDYLFWVAEQRDQFREDLRRYLRSDRVQREQVE